MKLRISGKAATCAGVAALFASLVACGGGGEETTLRGAAGASATADSALAQSYVEAAKAFAADFDNPIHQWTYRVWCENGYRTIPDRAANSKDPASRAVPGVRFMDNAWYFGADNSTLVVRTAAGNLLMFDALLTASEMQSHVIDQMNAAGLDPSRITHVFIGNESGNQQGGVDLVLRGHAPNAKVVATAPAAAAIAGVPIDITVTAAPDQDQGFKYIEVESGIKVAVMLTPGGTPGQMSVIVPVQHNGGTEKLLVWSGNEAGQGRTDLYASSTTHVEGFVVQEGATAWFNTQSYQGAQSGDFRRMKADPSYPKHILMGEEGVRRWAGIFANCNRALAQRYRKESI